LNRLTKTCAALAGMRVKLRLGRRGAPTPKVLNHEAQGRARFLRPTLGGNSSWNQPWRGCATPSGLTQNTTDTQGWPQKSRSTLGFVPMPSQGIKNNWAKAISRNDIRENRLHTSLTRMPIGGKIRP